MSNVSALYVASFPWMGNYRQVVVDGNEICYSDDGGRSYTVITCKSEQVKMLLQVLECMEKSYEVTLKYCMNKIDNYEELAHRYQDCSR